MSFQKPPRARTERTQQGRAHPRSDGPKGMIEEELSVDDVIARGFDVDTVKRIWRLLDRAEYKRRQAPPGVKITARAFGKDRRYPITNGFTKLI